MGAAGWAYGAVVAGAEAAGRSVVSIAPAAGPCCFRLSPLLLLGT
eukprot:COSAG06_NODE_2258_length_7221_cov_12.506599_4_plen_45_part_00